MTGSKLKGPIISHDTSNDGASQSLQPLLRNYDAVEADLIVQKNVLGTRDHGDVRKRFGSTSIVAAVDMKKNLFGTYEVFAHRSGRSAKPDLFTFLQALRQGQEGRYS